MKNINLQDNFLKKAKEKNIAITIYLISGYQIRGYVVGYDNYTILIDSEQSTQMIYKHAISTIIPTKKLELDI